MMKFLLIHSLLLTSLLHAQDEKQNNFFGSIEHETGLSGYLYDLKTTADNKPSELIEHKEGTKTGFYELFQKLIRKKFSHKELGKYFQGEDENHLKYLYVQGFSAEEATKEFGSDYIDPKQVIMVYTGEIEQATKKKFRFAGVFDDAMCVFVNDKMVFYVSRHEDELPYKPDAVSNRRKKEGVNHIAYGDEITLRKGDKVTIVLAEVPGGSISGRLLVQIDKFRYEEDKHEDPILHPFITEKLDDEDIAKLKNKPLELDRIPVFKFKPKKEE